METLKMREWPPQNPGIDPIKKIWGELENKLLSLQSGASDLRCRGSEGTLVLKTTGNINSLYIYANIYANIQIQSNLIRQRFVVLRVAARNEIVFWRVKKRSLRSDQSGEGLV